VDLDRARVAIDRTLAEVLDAGLRDAPYQVSEPIRYAVLAPGKRVRPLLVLAAHAAVADTAAHEPGPALLRLACAVELVHAYSLIHDDLPCMDDDDLRRGRPTVHVEFGVRIAILAGAALMPLAVELVGRSALEVGLNDGTAARLILILTAASGGGGMVGGQLLDLAAEGRVVDEVELERIHCGKTAGLIRAACLIGAISAGGSDDAVARAGRYGLSLGLAFQVVDDILDVTGTPQSMGKAGGRDAVLRKATFPTLVGVAGARRRARELLGAALAEVAALPGAAKLDDIASLVVERDR